MMMRKNTDVLQICGVIFILLLSEKLNIAPALNNLVGLASYVVVFMLAISQWKKLLYVAQYDLILCSFVGLAVISVCWSANPDASLEQIRAVIRTSIFGLFIATKYRSDQQLQLLVFTSVAAVVINLLVGGAFPSYAYQVYEDGFAFKGIFGHKQNLGRYIGFLAGIVLISMLKKSGMRSKLLKVGLLISMLGILLISNSKTGLLIYFLVLPFFPIYKIVKQQSKLRFLLLYGTFIIYIPLISLVALNFEHIVVDLLGKNLELNGRLPLWILGMQKFSERPWLGYGYNGFWGSSASDFVLRHSWATLLSGAGRRADFHSHSGYLDLLLQLGIIGFAVFVIHLAILFIRITYLSFLTRKVDHFWMFPLLAIYLYTNVTEGGSILSVNNILWIFYVSSSFTTVIEYKAYKKYLKEITIEYSEIKAGIEQVHQQVSSPAES